MTTATPRPATPELEQFVRKTLGCTCPNEVFEQVSEAPTEASLAAGVQRRIAIGGRLLVYLIEAENGVAASAKLRQWIAAGLTERDAMGMNRLRLAVVLRNPDPQGLDLLQRDFERVTEETDDRVHLHILDTAAAALIRQATAADIESPKAPSNGSNG